MVSSMVLVLKPADVLQTSCVVPEPTPQVGGRELTAQRTGAQRSSLSTSTSTNQLLRDP